MARSALLALVVGMLSPVLLGIPSAAAGPACTDVLLVGLAGSGEQPTTRAPFGRSLEPFRSAYLERAAGRRSVTQLYAGRGTAGVRTLKARRAASVKRAVTRDSVRRWAGPVGKDAGRLLDRLQAAVDQCPDQQVVVAGYAQGAMAAHRTVIRLPRHPEVQERLAAAVLVSDGDRTRSQAQRVGAPAARGGARGVQPFFARAVPPAPRDGQPVAVWSVCTARDLACDVRRVGFKEARRLHRSYDAGAGAAALAEVAAAVWQRTAPAPPVQTPAPSATPRLSAGGEHSCRLPGDGSLRCWGRNSYGQLGDGKTGTQATTEQRVGNGTQWRQVSAGGDATCGIRASGKLFCWGVNHKGQLGDGTTKVRTKPTAVVGDRRWEQVSVGWYNTCAVTRGQRAYCWGDNQAGQLADGTTRTRTAPVKVRGRDWEQLSVGSRFVCGVRTDGSLWCWGGNLFGQLGNGAGGNRTRPIRVGDRSDWAQVVTSWSHACARSDTGAVSCWGRNTWGQLGDGTTSAAAAPRQVLGGHRATDLALTEGGSCLLDGNGRSWCWGNNAYGQLADDNPGWTSTPVAGPAGLTEIDAGWRHVCGLTARATASCWGQNDRAQLGDGTTTSTPSATDVESPPATSRRGGTVFRLASMNALGHGHTRPYAHDDRFAPATTRATWLADSLAVLDVDVVGLQETTADHLSHVLKAARGRYDVFPRPAAGDLAVEAPLMWRTSVWEAVEKTTIKTQFIARVLPRPVVRLRHRVTGQEIWVMNVHNAPWDYQRKRNKATKVQLARIKELRESGLPVFFIGDMNEKRTLLCKVLRRTDLYSPIGGHLEDDGTCVNPPQRMRVDWIFGSEDVTFSRFEMNRHPLVTLTTDHAAPLVTVRVP